MYVWGSSGTKTAHILNQSTGLSFCKVENNGKVLDSSSETTDRKICSVCSQVYSTNKKKKRIRYKMNAIKIASEKGIPLNPDNWDEIWSVLESHKEPVYLYAILDIDSNKVKFGKSVSPGARLKSLKTGNGNRLCIMCYIEHKSPFTEREIHSLLSKHRVSGEWFLMCNETKEVIDSMHSKLKDKS